MFAFPVAFFSSAGSDYFKPVSRAGSALNYANAYDGTGTPGTTTTSATMASFSAAITTKYETYSFTGTTTYTKYKLYLTMDWSAGEGVDYLGEYVYGQVMIQYSLNGTTWTDSAIVDTGMLNGAYSYTTPINLGTLAATALDNFKVRIGVASSRVAVILEPITYEYAAASVTIKDIYISAEN